MIEIIATVDSIEQAQALLPLVDTIFFGEENFGLRLPYSFSRQEQKQLVDLAHQAHKKAMVAVNGLMHLSQMQEIPAYLQFLREIGVDKISLGDPGIIYVMQQNSALQLPFIYDGETLVTNARQINFWAKKGAIGAVLAREVPFAEMKLLAQQVKLPVEVLVYGATCIHQSKRTLLENYFNYTKQKEEKNKSRQLFLSEPQHPETHYSIFEDVQGTHIFANDDLCLMNELTQLVDSHYRTWKLDGIFSPGENFVKIAALYNDARQKIEKNEWSEEKAQQAYQKIRQLHPQNRTLSSGFYAIDPAEIK
ncbi:MAG TPA: peptidase U32 family protein [Tetragenococcus sp.]|nr:peptidase U32 family protein [Tetragenococcus sp.]